MKNHTRKELCQNINKLVLRLDMQSSDKSSCNFVSNNVTIYLHVFCSFMEYRIGCNVNCRLTIIENKSKLKMVELQISQESLQPGDFTCHSSHGPILCLS
jgi:hypothetical protein